MSVELPADPKAVDEARQQLRRIVQELDDLAAADPPSAEYYAGFLQRVVTALAAIGGAVWSRSSGGGWKLEHQFRLADTSLVQGTHDDQRHAALLEQTGASLEGRLVQPQHGGDRPNGAANPTANLLVLVPLAVEGRVAGLVEIVQRGNAPPPAQAGYLRFVQQCCSQASLWLVRQRLRSIADAQSFHGPLNAFALRVHEGLDAGLTGKVIVNEGLRLLGCDRVSLALPRGRRWRVVEVSGSDEVEARSNLLRAMALLADRVAAAGQPLWYAEGQTGLLPQVSQAVQHYVDEAYSTAVAVLPLRRPRATTNDAESEPTAPPGPGEIVGALLVEQIEDKRPWIELQSRVELLAAHAERALANVREHQDLFLMPLWRAVGKLRWVVRARTLPKTTAIGLLLLGMIGLLWLYPADVQISARGAARPVHRRHVFAGVAGTVQQVHVQPGDQVQAGQLLLTLSSPELAARIAETDRQHTIAAGLLAAANEGPDAAVLAGMRQQVGLLAARQRELADEQNALQVLSPLAGKVLDWNADEQLTGKPVAVGERLFSVADTAGPWELDLFVDEIDSGHVLQAQQADGPREVTFCLLSQPGTRHRGVVQEIGSVAETTGPGVRGVRVRVAVPQDQALDAPEGASVAAKIRCERSSLAHAWFHELWEYLQGRVF